MNDKKVLNDLGKRVQSFLQAMYNDQRKQIQSTSFQIRFKDGKCLEHYKMIYMDSKEIIVK